VLYWNTTGIFAFFLAIGVGVAVAASLAYFVGETKMTKGVGICVAGVFLLVGDLLLRFRHDKDYGLRRLFGDFGGMAAFPLWCFGIAGVLGGISVVFEGE